MYRRPQRIWVLAQERQCRPADAIFEPGTACGMPYAPEYRFCARTFQLLSLAQSGSSYRNCRFDQWNRCSNLLAICRGVSGGLIRRTATPLATMAGLLPDFDAVAKKASSCPGWRTDDEGRGPVRTCPSGRTRPTGLAIAAG